MHLVDEFIIFYGIHLKKLYEKLFFDVFFLFKNFYFQGKDDETGEALSQRDDDKPEVIRSRLDTYDKNTNPIADFYRKMNILQEFHGRESDKIWPEVKKYLDRVLNEPPARKQGA